jgi:hypothetical protein
VDLYKAIRELVEERKRIDRIIASLEAMLAKGDVPGQKIEKKSGKRRGRKGMGQEERKQVSERMARYWAQKRAEKQARHMIATVENGGEPAPPLEEA